CVSPLPDSEQYPTKGVQCPCRARQHIPTSVREHPLRSSRRCGPRPACANRSSCRTSCIPQGGTRRTRDTSEETAAPRQLDDTPTHASLPERDVSSSTPGIAEQDANREIRFLHQSRRCTYPSACRREDGGHPGSSR